MSQQRYQEFRHELDADHLIHIAKKESGLSDFGDNRFYEPLCKLLDCAAREVNFHVKGIEAFKNDINRCLVNRLRMQRDLNLHPEILQEDVSDPIIVIGLARSGTTKLQRMLAAPDSVQKNPFWRTWNPAPFPDAIPGKPDPRIAAARLSHFISSDNPILDAAHHVQEQEVEEEGFFSCFTFEDWVWCQLVPIPSYFDWVMSRPSLEAFRYGKTILQYLQWQDGGKRGRPWVLKNNVSLANVDSLLACYPNATLMHTHRDPRETIASFSKITCGVWPIQSNPVDPRFIGTEVLKMFSVSMDRYLEARDRLALDDRILDVKYEQVRNDPMTIIREVYRRGGRILSAEAEQKMADWHAVNEQNRYGKHEYSLKEFGLDEASIDEAFRKYIKRFIDR